MSSIDAAEELLQHERACLVAYLLAVRPGSLELAAVHIVYASVSIPNVELLR